VTDSAGGGGVSAAGSVAMQGVRRLTARALLPRVIIRPYSLGTGLDKLTLVGSGGRVKSRLMVLELSLRSRWGWFECWEHDCVIWMKVVSGCTTVIHLLK
jgi:hypothetical protein